MINPTPQWVWDFFARKRVAKAVTDTELAAAEAARDAVLDAQRAHSLTLAAALKAASLARCAGAPEARRLDDTSYFKPYGFTPVSASGAFR